MPVKDANEHIRKLQEAGQISGIVGHHRIIAVSKEGVPRPNPKNIPQETWDVLFKKHGKSVPKNRNRFPQ